MEDAGGEILALVDEGGDQLGHVDLAGAHGHELMPVVGKVSVDQLLGVVDLPHGGDGVKPEVGADQQRLGVGIRDAADADGSGKLVQVFLKFGAEGRVRDGMDLPLAAALAAPDRHAGVPGAEVAVVVRPEEHVQHHIAVRDRAEESAHYAKNSSDRVIGSMYLPSL